MTPLVEIHEVKGPDSTRATATDGVALRVKQAPAPNAAATAAAMNPNHVRRWARINVSLVHARGRRARVRSRTLAGAWDEVAKRVQPTVRQRFSIVQGPERQARPDGPQRP
jgi:hypothetical protein